MDETIARFKEYLQKLVNSEILSFEEATDALAMIFSGSISESLLASFFTAMSLRGETIEELSAFVKVMRAHSNPVKITAANAIDIVGTGGDKSGTFNISTITSFVAAAAGAPVMKHGNRSASSQCGSADVLEFLGADIELNAGQVARVFEETGIAFMYAPMFHPAMKYVMPTRKELGFRTFFNILGPLANPAGVSRYVIGAFSKDVAEKMIKILGYLGTDFAYSFHSLDGLDEVSLCADTYIYELRESVRSGPILFRPEDLDFKRTQIEKLQGGDVATNAKIFANILDDKGTEEQTNMIVLNAAFAIRAAGATSNLGDAKKMAAEALKSGEAKRVFESFIEATKNV